MRSAHNTGSIYRTAAAFGFDAIIHSGITPNNRNPLFKKASRGTEHFLRTIYFESILDSITYALELKCKIYGLEINESAEELLKCECNLPFAIILGNEANGISAAALEKCERIFEIRTTGIKHSLNVANSFAIFAHHIFNKTC